MDFKTAVRTCLTKYATFQGRAHRPEYWWFILFSVLVQVIASMIDDGLLGFDAGGGPLSGIAALALLLPTLAAGARRLHDIGRSGWWQLLHLVPIIGSLVLLWWFTRPGETTANAYGGPA